MKKSILCILLLLFSCINANIAYANEITDSHEIDTEELNNYIENCMKKGNLPGMSVVVVSGDRIIYQEEFGHADVDNKIGIDSDTYFEISSNSKAFTALAILNLCREGDLSLEDNISDYIHDLQFYYNGEEQEITVQQCLNHCSGIPYNTIQDIPISDKESALKETVMALDGTKLVFLPGEKFEYVTINYDILGLIIQNISDVSYETYIRDYILEPLGLNSTILYKDDTFGKLAIGYKLSFFKSKEYDAPFYGGNKPAGYIMSTSNDIARWLMLQMGTIDAGELADLINKSHVPNLNILPDEGAYYADGWYVYPSAYGELCHAGNNPNYSSYIVIKPSEKIAVAVLCNQNTDYVIQIGDYIKTLLVGGDQYQIQDTNSKIDGVSSCLAIALLILSSILVVLLVKMICEFIMKRRFFSKCIFFTIGKIIAAFLLIIGITYGIERIPYVFYYETSWKFLNVWLPNSIKYAHIMLLITIWLVFVYCLLKFTTNSKIDNNIFTVSLLSIASGLGNAIIILSINLAIYSSNEAKLRMLLYFVLGLFLYIVGQILVRSNLIKMTNNIVYSKRVEIIEKLLETNYECYEDINEGVITATLNNDPEVISKFANAVIGGLTSLVTLVCCFIYLGLIDKFALLLSIVIILVIASLYFAVGTYANKIGEKSRDLQNVFFGNIHDLTAGFKELCLSQIGRKVFLKDVSENCRNYKDKSGEASMAYANMFVIGELLFTIAIGIIVFIFPAFISNMNNNDNITSYVFVLLYMTGPLNSILDAIPNVIATKISYGRIEDLLNKIQEDSYDIRRLKNSKNIELDVTNVEYEYLDPQDKHFYIGPINYKFKSGEIIFITGGNGSGKSTLAKVITGLYKPTKGKIEINGVEMHQKEIREYFSAIFSDFYLFRKLYGIDTEYLKNQISFYLHELGLEEKVSINNGSFSTTDLSTGQRKRLALLVAYLRNRPIYLFDEWAADQDPQFRRFFYETLLPDLKKNNKCVIAITHDDRYFHLADKIIKMEMGIIVEYEV